MEIFRNPQRNDWNRLCSRPASYNPQVQERVRLIIDHVRIGGDKALVELAKEIDSIELKSLRVSKEEFETAENAVTRVVKEAIKDAYANIEKFHKAQMPSKIEVQTAPGVKCIQKPVPIEKVGLYIPGGTAPLFSTVLMLAIPAKIAGCGSVVLCTPASKSSGLVNPEVLYAAQLCGITEVYKIGGAQAIAAMALGTETIPKVHKIFGPGNQYVTTAKQLLGGRYVAIDMPAGPSEVMVVADESSDPAFAAADLLSQAEHGADSQAMLVCRSQEFAIAVQEQIDLQLKALGRASIALQALEKSRSIIFDDVEDVIDFANLYAPEHLIVSTEKPWDIVDRITSAGSVFVGRYTPESAGDYASGTNHTLPTCGWAHSHSGVNIDSYMRKMTIQEISRDGLSGLGGTIVTMALAEGLQAHANAVKVRTDEN